MFDADGEVDDTEEKKTTAPESKLLCFIGSGNNPTLPKEVLIEKGFQVMPRGMQFSDTYRFKWTQTPHEINYMKIVEGKHLVNHFSNTKIFTSKISTLDTLESLNRALANGDIASPHYKSTKEFTPETYRLDVVADLVSFLKSPSEGLWLVKHSNSN